METADLARILIARFSPGQRPLKEFPHSIRWENGTLATKDDFEAHILDTYAITGDVKKGMEIQMFPNIVADVRFDTRRAAWVHERARCDSRYPRSHRSQCPGRSDNRKAFATFGMV